MRLQTQNKITINSLKKIKNAIFKILQDKSKTKTEIDD